MEHAMNRRVAVAIVALAIGLSACSKEDPGTWGRSGADERAVDRVSATCRAQARKYVNREIDTQPGVQDSIRPHDSRTVTGVFTRLELDKTYQRVFDNCMQAAGYSQEQK